MLFLFPTLLRKIQERETTRVDQAPEGTVDLSATAFGSGSADHGEVIVAVGFVDSGGQDVGDPHQVI